MCVRSAGRIDGRLIAYADLFVAGMFSLVSWGLQLGVRAKSQANPIVHELMLQELNQDDGCEASVERGPELF